MQAKKEAGMPKLTAAISRVTEVLPADPGDALRHFEGLLALETDCWDVHESMKNGIEGWKDEGFALTAS